MAIAKIDDRIKILSIKNQNNNEYKEIEIEKIINQTGVIVYIEPNCVEYAVKFDKPFKELCGCSSTKGFKGLNTGEGIWILESEIEFIIINDYQLELDF